MGDLDAGSGNLDGQTLVLGKTIWGKRASSFLGRSVGRGEYEVGSFMFEGRFAQLTVLACRLRLVSFGFGGSAKAWIHLLPAAYTYPGDFMISGVLLAHYLDVVKGSQGYNFTLATSISWWRIFKSVVNRTSPADLHLAKLPKGH